MKHHRKKLGWAWLLCLMLCCSSTNIFAQESAWEDELSVDLYGQLSEADGIKPGQKNILRVHYHNQGDVYFRDAQIRLVLPEELQMYSGSEMQSIGFFSVAQRGSVTFSLTAEEDVKARSYPVQIELSGVDRTGSTRTVSRTIYFPVLGTTDETAFSIEDLQITAIELPEEAVAGEDFRLRFAVTNNGNSKAPALRIEAELPEGLMNRSAAQFLESSLPAGASRTYSIEVFSNDEAKEGYYPISLRAETVEQGEEGSGELLQYTGLFLNNEEATDAVKTPRLLVEAISYGGEILAGDTFQLQFQLRNTSRTDLRNVLIHVSSNGTFLPVRSGGTLYLQDIPAQQTKNCSVTLSVKPDAEPKPEQVEINLAYEDGQGNEYSASSSLALPIQQPSRLTLEEVESYGEFYTGMENNASIAFYNMGKSTLYNLRIDAEGNFDSVQTNGVYLGNMASGESDDYSFSIVPREGDTVSGTVRFTFETSAGTEQTIEKTFSFPVIEQVPWEEPMPEEILAEEPASSLRPEILIGVGILSAILFSHWKKTRRKKKERELELEDV